MEFTETDGRLPVAVQRLRPPSASPMPRSSLATPRHSGATTLAGERREHPRIGLCVLLIQPIRFDRRSRGDELRDDLIIGFPSFGLDVIRRLADEFLTAYSLPTCLDRLSLHGGVGQCVRRRNIRTDSASGRLRTNASELLCVPCPVAVASEGRFVQSPTDARSSVSAPSTPSPGLVQGDLPFACKSAIPAA